MYDVMVINNGSRAANSRSLQMDHLKCCEPPARRIAFSHGGAGRGLRSPTFSSSIGVGVDKKGDRPAPEAQATPSFALATEPPRSGTRHCSPPRGAGKGRSSERQVWPLHGP